MKEESFVTLTIDVSVIKLISKSLMLWSDMLVFVSDSFSDWSYVCVLD
jgi:hypothetical protein